MSKLLERTVPAGDRPGTAMLYSRPLPPPSKTALRNRVDPPPAACPSGRHRRHRHGAARLPAPSAGPPRQRHRRPALSADVDPPRSGRDPPVRRLRRRPSRARAGPGGHRQRRAARQSRGGRGRAARPPRLSMPEALARFFLADRRPLVVAGTHGKTTTTAMAAWVYDRAGPRSRLPDRRRAARPRRQLPPRRRRALRDRGRRVQRRLLRPRPEVPALPARDADPDHRRVRPRRPLPDAGGAARRLRRADRRCCRRPGLLVACGDSAKCASSPRAARAPVVLYGEQRARAVRLLCAARAARRRRRFRLRDESGEEVEVALPLWGVHNAANALAVWAAARRDGIAVDALAAALAALPRRQAPAGARRRRATGSRWSTTSPTTRRRSTRPSRACARASRAGGCWPASSRAA